MEQDTEQAPVQTQIERCIAVVNVTADKLDRQAVLLHEICNKLGLPEQPYPTDLVATANKSGYSGQLGMLDEACDHMNAQREQMTIAIARIAQIVGK